MRERTTDDRASAVCKTGTAPRLQTCVKGEAGEIRDNNVDHQ